MGRKLRPFDPLLNRGRMSKRTIVIIIVLVAVLAAGVALAVYLAQGLSAGSTEAADPTQTKDQSATIDATVSDGASAELSAYTIDTDYYTFVIPEYWRDKVAWSQDGDTLTVYCSEFSGDSSRLVTISVTDSSEMAIGGDIANSRVAGLDNGRGQRVEVRATNYLYLAQEVERSGDVSEVFSSTEAETELVDLSTGGAYSAEDPFTGGEEGNGATNGLTYYEDSVVPCITLK